MAHNSDRFIWYLAQRSSGQAWLSAVDDIEHWSFDIQFHDWGICPKLPVSLLSMPCCLWIHFVEISNEKDLE